MAFLNKVRIFERRKSQQGSNEWLTIYSDLMTNLMLFFLMLFALTRLSTEEKSRVYNSLKKNFTTIQEQSRFKKVVSIKKETEDNVSELLSQLEGMTDIAKINISEQYIKMRLPSPVLFEPGSVEMNEKGKIILGQIAQILKPILHEIVVEGHSDIQPVSDSSKYFSNWELSGARALAAVNCLVEQGIDPKRLSAVGYGPYHPIYPNDTKENRSKNRRIEINIVREK